MSCCLLVSRFLTYDSNGPILHLIVQRLPEVFDIVGIYSQRFGAAVGTVLDVQALGIAGVTDIEVTGVKIIATASEPKRTAFVTLDIDGESYEIDLEFADESFNAVGLTGRKLEAPAPL